MKAKFCILKKNGEYVPVEIEPGKASNFIYKVFDEYRVDRFISESKIYMIHSVCDYSKIGDKPYCEKSYFYEKLRYDWDFDNFVLYSNKIYLKSYYKDSHEDGLKARIDLGFMMDKFNEQDKINTGLIIEDKFISLWKIYSTYDVLYNRITTEYITLYDKEYNKVEIGLDNNNCMEVILKVNLV